MQSDFGEFCASDNKAPMTVFRNGSIRLSHTVELRVTLPVVAALYMVSEPSTD